MLGRPANEAIIGSRIYSFDAESFGSPIVDVKNLHDGYMFITLADGTVREPAAETILYFDIDPMTSQKHRTTTGR